MIYESKRDFFGKTLFSVLVGLVHIHSDDEILNPFLLGDHTHIVQTMTLLVFRKIKKSISQNFEWGGAFACTRRRRRCLQFDSGPSHFS